MRVLFIGGTGIISSACTKLAVENGIELYHLNRGNSIRPIPEAVQTIIGDIRNKDSIKKKIDDKKFDVVVDWVAYIPEHIETDLELFKDRVGQYIFISSASAYQTPPAKLPVTEDTPLDNPFWKYSQGKIDCEKRLQEAYESDKFPITIVRPSHTYDRMTLPLHGRFTTVNRMRKGKKVIVHGDGSSIWVLTHHKDFAKGFVGLLGNPKAVGEAYHITSDELLTWNQIYDLIAEAAGTEAKKVHIPSDIINKYDKEWGEGLLGDKAHSMIFDNSKIKNLVPEFEAAIPFSQGAKEIISWVDEDQTRQVIDESLDKQMDEMINSFESLI